ncbi:MAG TPA: endonuclease/exonuclease/phosphatase family protein [Gemmatimonadales bacterium]
MNTVLRIATLNLWHGSRLERAISVARADPGLAEADVLALQESDEQAAERFASALGMGYLYYPAVIHYRTGRHFAPALLSRWPIVDHRRVDLPHLGLWGMRRIAVAATLLVRNQPVIAYAVHFGTLREILPPQQNAQARAVLLDAAAGSGPALVAGDLNRKGIGRLFQAAGWRWITRDVGRTHRIWSYDHVFVRGFDGAAARSGTVRAALAASDHRAVWAEVSSDGS